MPLSSSLLYYLLLLLNELKYYTTLYLSKSQSVGLLPYLRNCVSFFHLPYSIIGYYKMSPHYYRTTKHLNNHAHTK